MLLTASGDRVLRFSPPLIVSIAELERGGALGALDAREIPDLTGRGRVLNVLSWVRRQSLTPPRRGSALGGPECPTRPKRPRSCPARWDPSRPSRRKGRRLPGVWRAARPDSGRPRRDLREGRFHYFCRAGCKQAFLREKGRPSEEDVETRRPPPVAQNDSVAFGPELDGPPSRVRAKRPAAPVDEPPRGDGPAMGGTWSTCSASLAGRSFRRWSSWALWRRWLAYLLRWRRGARSPCVSLCARATRPTPIRSSSRCRPRARWRRRAGRRPSTIPTRWGCSSSGRSPAPRPS